MALGNADRVLLFMFHASQSATSNFGAVQQTWNLNLLGI